MPNSYQINLEQVYEAFPQVYHGGHYAGRMWTRVKVIDLRDFPGNRTFLKTISLSTPDGFGKLLRSVPLPIHLRDNLPAERAHVSSKQAAKRLHAAAAEPNPSSLSSSKDTCMHQEKPTL
ncbi:hypothetical protein VNI00_008555 [Paramarasmius palmivorus]|uniref:Uncharacterized protein n=1 Tax=Paramarasmius palmivorus TaxID=297713 RepID=A0AAW0CTL8_9AGAR